MAYRMHILHDRDDKKLGVGIGHFYFGFENTITNEIVYYGKSPAIGFMPLGMAKINEELDRINNKIYYNLDTFLEAKHTYKIIEISQLQYESGLKYAKSKEKEWGLYIASVEDCIEFTQEIYNKAGQQGLFSNLFTTKELKEKMGTIASMSLLSRYGSKDSPAIVKGISEQEVATRFNVPVEWVMDNYQHDIEAIKHGGGRTYIISQPEIENNRDQTEKVFTTLSAPHGNSAQGIFRDWKNPLSEEDNEPTQSVAAVSMGSSPLPPPPPSAQCPAPITAEPEVPAPAPVKPLDDNWYEAFNKAWHSGMMFKWLYKPTQQYKNIGETYKPVYGTNPLFEWPSNEHLFTYQTSDYVYEILEFSNAKRSIDREVESCVRHDLCSFTSLSQIAFKHSSKLSSSYKELMNYAASKIYEELSYKAIFGKWSREFKDLIGYAASHVSPLVFDLNGDGIKLKPYTKGVLFDIDNDGFMERVGWPEAEDGQLARDINNNGKIDDITELFGDDMINAFFKLNTLDSNKDKVIDKNDEKFGELLMWQDKNQNGYSDPSVKNMLQ